MKYEISQERMASFESFLEKCQTGDVIVYHEGESCAGSYRAAVRIASETGKVILVQKKLGPFRFQYIAIVR